MEELTLQKDALAIAKKNMMAYFENFDLGLIAEDAEYKNLATGQIHTGKTEIAAMLHYVYHVAFEARIDVQNIVVTEEKAYVEGYFTGKHIGEYLGIPATGREVKVPVSVSYDLENGLIKKARIYMITDELRKQLGVSATSQKTTYLVRDIFQLKFGRFKEAKILLAKASENKLLPEAQQMRVLTDFTGDSYRMIFEEGFDSIADYEISLSSSMKTKEWQDWYELFKPNVERSHREILKQVL